MPDLSPHFDRSEFRCKGTGALGHMPHGTPVSPVLVQRLERLRELAGSRPLSIVSGYRCPWHNRRVGGAGGSQHLLGCAADIPNGYAELELARAAGFTGIGLSGAWAVHVDVRARPATWVYR